MNLAPPNVPPFKMYFNCTNWIRFSPSIRIVLPATVDLLDQVRTFELLYENFLAAHCCTKTSFFEPPSLSSPYSLLLYTFGSDVKLQPCSKPK
ncbi:hypothetical protein WN55_00171 [Dufourea novaeangliae]|uniref:Uncharacterized protein n=1 Tax=Dufourea novaeangliae TaxID=178035 RepID=A0A154PC49_DUFNO|nr:hypothetical protein WN55_00171 [Dufourea novaeangliae]